MPSPDSYRTRSEIHRTFTTRLTELANLGVQDLIFEHGRPSGISYGSLSVVSEFQGEPNVVIKATRNLAIQYNEVIMLEFDGTCLVIRGADQVFSGQIPTDEASCSREIGDAIKQAFNNPIISKIVQ